MTKTSTARGERRGISEREPHWDAGVRVATFPPGEKEEAVERKLMGGRNLQWLLSLNCQGCFLINCHREGNARARRNIGVKLHGWGKGNPANQTLRTKRVLGRSKAKCSLLLGGGKGKGGNRQQLRRENKVGTSIPSGWGRQVARSVTMADGVRSLKGRTGKQKLQKFEAEGGSRC